MDSTQARAEGVRSGYLNSGAMITGLAFLTVGGVIGAWGMGISGVAMMRKFRRWLSAQQQPVSAIAGHRTVPAKTGTTVNGGRKEMATQSAR